MKTLFDFIVRSSADPTKLSLSIRGIGLMLVAWIGAEGAQIMGVMCEVGSYCYPVTPDLVEQLKHIVDIIAQAVFFLMSGVGMIVALYGGIRKAWLTWKGENKALQ